MNQPQAKWSASFTKEVIIDEQSTFSTVYVKVAAGDEALDQQPMLHKGQIEIT